MHQPTSSDNAAATPTTLPRPGGGLIVLEQEALAARPSNASWSATPAGNRSPAFHVTRPRPDISAGAIEHAWRDDGAGPERFRSERAAARAAARLNEALA